MHEIKQTISDIMELRSIQFCFPRKSFAHLSNYGGGGGRSRTLETSTLKGNTWFNSVSEQGAEEKICT
jgi:hypothetical protein